MPSGLARPSAVRVGRYDQKRPMAEAPSVREVQPIGGIHTLGLGIAGRLTSQAPSEIHVLLDEELGIESLSTAYYLKVVGNTSNYIQTQ